MQMKKMLCLLVSLCLLTAFVCGASAESCAHKLSSERTGIMNRGACVPINGQIHAYTHDVGTYRQCAYCDKEFAVTTQKTGLRVEEEHRFDEGVCRECGYVNTCAHTSVYRYTEKDTWRKGEPADDRFHRIDYDEYTRVWCKDCGEMIENTRSESAGTILEGHEFSDGICDNCGYAQKACAHENVGVGYYYYEHYDDYKNVTYTDLRHTYEAKVYASMVCKDCGVYTEDVPDHTEIITESHWIDDGVCQVCDYNPDECTHQHTQMIEEFESNWRRTVSIDAKSHRVYGNVVQYEQCIACKERVSDLKIIEFNCSEVYQHQFSISGRCYDCEYRIACRHPQKATQDWYWSDRNAAPVNDTEHVLYADHMEETICAECGIAFDSYVLEIGAARTEKHCYSQDGVCQICEYVRGSMKSVEGAVAESVSELAAKPVAVPTLVSEDIPEGVFLVYEQKENAKANTVMYDISLKNRLGEVFTLEGEALLLLPYPIGMDKDSAAALDITIVHYGDAVTETFSTENGTVEILAQGLGVRVHSLSPFEITWQEKPEADLPQTGDDSCLLFWMLMLVMTAGTLGCRRARENG